MCHHCRTAADRISQGELSAAQADRLRTSIAICERYAEQPRRTVTVISEGALNDMSAFEADRQEQRVRKYIKPWPRSRKLSPVATTPR